LKPGSPFHFSQRTVLQSESQILGSRPNFTSKQPREDNRRDRREAIIHRLGRLKFAQLFTSAEVLVTTSDGPSFAR
jgi:hypothetical protein